MLKHATGMFLNAKIPQGDFLRCAPVAILGLPGKIGNANTEASTEMSGLTSILQQQKVSSDVS